MTSKKRTQRLLRLGVQAAAALEQMGDARYNSYCSGSVDKTRNIAYNHSAPPVTALPEQQQRVRLVVHSFKGVA